MKPSFSERLGFKQARVVLVRETLTNDLRNSLWSVVSDAVLNSISNEREFDGHGGRTKYSPLANFYRGVWRDFFKLPIDQLSNSLPNGEVHTNYPYREVRDWFFTADWMGVYEFLEFCVDSQGELLASFFNVFLKRELSAYRFIGGILVEINSQEEIAEIETALNITDRFNPVKTHLSTALSLISDKKKPDYRNSVKESISAVESLSKIIIEDGGATLGAALKIIEQKHKIPNSLKAGFSAIYGYTSDEGGIRHALLEGDIEVGIDEARFMIVACSAFVNYLISKI